MEQVGCFVSNYCFYKFNLRRDIFYNRQSLSRCSIPECENETSINYTIPHIDGKPSKCLRYPRFDNYTLDLNDTCLPNHYDPSNVITCESFLYLESHSIVKEVSVIWFLSFECLSRLPSQTLCRRLTRRTVFLSIHAHGYTRGLTLRKLNINRVSGRFSKKSSVSNLT